MFLTIVYEHEAAEKYKHTRHEHAKENNQSLMFCEWAEAILEPLTAGSLN